MRNHFRAMLGILCGLPISAVAGGARAVPGDMPQPVWPKGPPAEPSVTYAHNARFPRQLDASIVARGGRYVLLLENEFDHPMPPRKAIKCTLYVVEPKTGGVRTAGVIPGRSCQVGSISADGGRVLVDGKLWDVRAGPSTEPAILLAASTGESSLSADGKWIGFGLESVAGRRDLPVSLNLKSVDGGPMQCISANAGVFEKVAISVDSSMVATGGWSGDQTVRVYDVATRQKIGHFEGHAGVVTSVCFSDDGQYLASADARVARVWDIKAAKEVRSLATGWDDGMTCVAISPDHRLLAAVNGRVGGGGVWDLQAGKPLLKLGNYAGGAGGSVAFTTDGRQLVTAASGRIGVFDLPAVAATTEPITLAPLTAATSQPVAREIARASFDAPLVGIGKVAAQGGFAILPDGKIRVGAASAGANAFMLTLDPLAGPDVAVVPLPPARYCELTAINAAGKVAVGIEQPANGPTEALAWNAESGALLAKHPLKAGVYASAVSSDGLVAATSQAKWNALVPPSTAPSTVPSTQPVEGSNGNRAARGTVAGPSSQPATRPAPATPQITVRAEVTRAHQELPWVSQTLPRKVRVPVHVTIVLPPAGGPPKAEMSDAEVQVWDVRTGKTRVVLPMEGRVVKAMAFSPDGARLVTGSDAVIPEFIRPPAHPTAGLRLWDVATAAEIAHFDAALGVSAVAFSPDGSRILVAGQDALRYRYLWLLDGKSLAPIWPESLPDEAWGQAVAFSPDGGRALVGELSDNSIRLIDIADGNTLWRFESPKGAVTSLRFFPDGKRAVSMANDRTIRVWQLP